MKKLTFAAVTPIFKRVLTVAAEQPCGVQVVEWVGLIYDDAFGLAGFMDAENQNYGAFVLGFCGVYLFKGHFHYITGFTRDVDFAFLNQCYRALYYVAKFFARVPVCRQACVGRNGDTADDNFGIFHSGQFGSQQVFQFRFLVFI